jgi:hypothetical protein
MRHGKILNAIKVILLLVAALVSAYLLLKREYVQAALIFCMMLYLGFNLYAQYNFLARQLIEFSEAVKYRDFTRRFLVKNTKSVEGQLLWPLIRSTRLIRRSALSRRFSTNTWIV